MDGAGADGQPLGFDVEQFRLWYHQAGTPHIEVNSLWDAKTGRLRLTLKQFTSPTPGQERKQALVIPVLWAVLKPDGSLGDEQLMVLDQD